MAGIQAFDPQNNVNLDGNIEHTDEFTEEHDSMLEKNRSSEENNLNDLGRLALRANIQDPDVAIGLSFKRWIVLFVFCQISLANAAMWITFPSISNVVMAYYKVSYVVVNWFSMAFLLGYSIFALPASVFLLKYGVKSCILVAASLNGVGACLRYAGVDKNRFVFVAIGQIFAAIGSAFVLQVPPKLAAVWFGEHERAKATSIGVLLHLVGAAVGFIQPTILVQESENMDIVRDGMNILLTSQALFCLACVVLAYAFVDEKPKLPPSLSEALRDEESMLPLSFTTSTKKLFGSKSFNLTSQAYGIMFAIMTAVSTLLNQTVKSKYLFVPDSRIGILAFIATLLGSASTFLVGVIVDKYQNYKQTAVTLFLLATLSLAGFTVVLLNFQNFVVLSIMLSLFNCSLLPYLSSGLEQIAEITYPVEEDISCSLPLMFGNFYGFLAVYMFGWLIEKGLVQLAFGIMIAILGLGLLFVIIAKVPMRRTMADHGVAK